MNCVVRCKKKNDYQSSLGRRGGLVHRMRNVSELWNWLPAFRAVAETEHLPTASKQLRVSASALSRSLRLLEEAVGSALFERAGRELQLNAAGHALLAATRDAMRMVDDGLAAVDDAQFRGPVLISAVGAEATFSPRC
jgi:DNA-binding transcriptional LysR family regulator